MVWPSWKRVDFLLHIVQDLIRGSWLYWRGVDCPSNLSVFLDMSARNSLNRLCGLSVLQDLKPVY